MKASAIIILTLIGIATLTFISAGTPFVLNIVKHRIETSIQEGIDTPISIGSLHGNLLYTLEIQDLDLDSIVILKRGVITYNVFKLLSNEVEIKNLLLEGLAINVNDLKRLATKPPQETRPGQSRFSIHIKRLSLEKSNLFGRVNDIPLNATVQLNGSLTPLCAVIDTLIIQTQHSILSGHGTIPLADSGSLDVAYDLNALLDEVPVEHLSGHLHSTGLLTGSTENPRIESQMTFAAYYDENEFTGTATIHWQTPSLDSLVIHAQIDAKMTSLEKNVHRKDKWQARISTEGKKFLCTVASPYGSANLNGSLQGDIGNPVIAANVDAAFSYGRLTPKIHARIEFQEQVATIKRLMLQDKTILLNANASVSMAQPHAIRADMTATCSDISFLASFIQNVEPMSGKAFITARAQGTVTQPDIAATVRFDSAAAYGEAITAADFILAFHDSVLAVSKGNIQSLRGELDITGQYSITDGTFAAHIHSDSLHLASPEVWGTDTIPLSGKIGLDAQVSGTVNNPQGSGRALFVDFSYDTVDFDGYELSFALQNHHLDIILADKKPSMNIASRIRTVAPYEFTALLRMDEFAVQRFVLADTALLTGTVSVEGCVNNLSTIKGSASVSRLVYTRQDYRIENADTLVVKLDNKNLQFEAFELLVQGQAMHVRGRVPLDFQKGTFDVVCSAEQFDLAPLAALVPDAPDIKGFLSANVTFTGTVKEPMINGELSVHDGGLTMTDVVLDSVNGDISFEKDAITIEQIIGSVNRGRFSTYGTIHLAKEKLDLLSLQTTVTKVEYRSGEYGRYVISGELTTSARHDSILLTGDITLDEAVYDIPFNVQTIIRLLTSVNRPPPEQAEILKRTYSEVGITTPHGIRIKNNIADVTAEADLQVRGLLSRINIYGRITTSQTGTVRYLGRKFDIVNAIVEFDNPYTIDPVLNLEATTFVSSVDGDYDITLQLSGTIENWRLALSSSPAVAEQDIISLILIGRRRPTTGIVAGGEGFNLKGAARDYALDLARGNIERTAERTLGLDKVTISGDLLAPRDVSIGIEKKLSRRLTLVYGTGIESWELYRIGFNYDITDNLSIFTLHDQENLNSSVDLDIHLDLK
jgi:autotransporter translocation and assembly factor TamB